LNESPAVAKFAMKTFRCTCHAPIFFYNTSCINCKRELGYLPDQRAMSAIEPAQTPGEYKALAAAKGRQAYRKCENYAKENVCNWLVPAQDPSPLCTACRLNRTIPSLDRPEHREYWVNIEAAKRRLVYSLLELSLPLKSKEEDDANGLAFDFLARPSPGDGPAASGDTAPKVMTGHADGLITLDITEADEVAREQVRQRLHETYRTLLGHFRHESGHYYWQRLISPSQWIEPFRKLFGDERKDYQKALAEHYENQATSDWQGQFISHYASSHPWEDWAETWAHYLHMIDTLETARTFGIVSEGRGRDLINPKLFGTGNAPPVRPAFAKVLREWVWLSLAMNSINRSMGMRDPYPFVLSEPVAKKLEMVEDVVRAARER
jgi:hypothetical protein